jgi:hypothetical protein
MRRLRVVLPILLLVIVVVSAVLVLRARGNAETGPALALCPGPDAYGYRCEPGATYEYIDATNDTFLYADEGTVVVDLPFAFTFYGSSYQQVALSSNGNLQFTTENTAFSNECLNEGPIQSMGELIAPYWDDLDLTLIGFLETAVVGEAGSRIFVIEWDDIPAYGDPNDRVTFEVQLFEGSNDIVFLYQDVTRTTANNGRSATIGLQSENRGNTLQFACDQLALINSFVLYFPHPENPAQASVPVHNPMTGLDTAVSQPKGDMNVLIERLNRDGVNALQRMQAYWLSQQPQKEVQTRQADITGDGQEELILLLRPPIAFAEQTELAVFAKVDERNQGWELLYHSFPLARQGDDGRFFSLDIVADKTADGLLDVLILDGSTGETFVLSAAGESFELNTLVVP